MGIIEEKKWKIQKILTNLIALITNVDNSTTNIGDAIECFTNQAENLEKIEIFDKFNIQNLRRNQRNYETSIKNEFLN